MTRSTIKRPIGRLTGRTALKIMLMLAPLTWLGLLLFTRYIPPQSVLAFAVVFLLIGIALTCTLSPLVYFISLHFISSRLYRATVRHALRQGALFSVWVVFNLLLRTLHSWNIFTCVISFGIIVIIEILSLGRK